MEVEVKVKIKTESGKTLSFCKKDSGIVMEVVTDGYAKDIEDCPLNTTEATRVADIILQICDSIEGRIQTQIPLFSQWDPKPQFYYPQWWYPIPCRAYITCISSS